MTTEIIFIVDPYDAAQAKAGRFGDTQAEYLAAEKVYCLGAIKTDWSVIEAGGARLARTVDGKTTILTRVGDPSLADRIATLLGTLTGYLPSGLHDLAVASAGSALDMPRLARHIWDTGTDPTHGPGGSAAHKLAELATLTRPLPDPVRSAIAETVFERWDWFGPVLVPATATWWDTAYDTQESMMLDISAPLAIVADDDLVRALADPAAEHTLPGIGHDVVASASWLDKGAQDALSTCDLNEGVTLHLSRMARLALGAWVQVHRPHLGFALFG